MKAAKIIKMAPAGLSTDYIFKASKRQSDGLIPVVDMVLQMLLPIALGFPGAEKASGVRINMTSKGPGSRTVDNVVAAVFKKHKFIGRGIRQKNVCEIARALVLDILVNKIKAKRVTKPYARILAAFAERDDIAFFEQLALGIKRKRMPVFKPIDWLLLLNWDEWTQFARTNNSQEPSLKHWTAEAILGLAESLDLGNDRLNASGLRTRRDALGLQQASETVTGVVPVRGADYTFKTQTKD